MGSALPKILLIDLPFVQYKVLKPLLDVEQKLLDDIDHFKRTERPYKEKFDDLLKNLDDQELDIKSQHSFESRKLEQLSQADAMIREHQMSEIFKKHMLKISLKKQLYQA